MIGPIITRGYGLFGSVNLVAMRGYSAGAAATTRSIPVTWDYDDHSLAAMWSSPVKSATWDDDDATPDATWSF